MPHLGCAVAVANWCRSRLRTELWAGRTSSWASGLLAAGRCPLGSDADDQGGGGTDFDRSSAGSRGADASDLLGGMSVHNELKRSQRFIGLAGAVLGIGIGLWGAARPGKKSNLAGDAVSSFQE